MKWWHATDLADAQSGYLESLAFSAADAQSPEVVFIHDFDDDLKTESIRHVPSHLSRSLVTLENYCGNISRIKKCEEASLVMVRFVTQITPIEQDCEQALDHGPIGNYSAKNRHRFDSHDPKHASADVKTKKVGAMITVTNREAVQEPDSITALFTGADYQADVSFFWVDSPPGEGQEFHWHPYAETWAVLHGEALVDTQDEQLRAYPGDIVTVSARKIHRYRTGGEVNLRMICIHPSPRVVEEFI